DRRLRRRARPVGGGHAAAGAGGLLILRPDRPRRATRDPHLLHRGQAERRALEHRRSYPGDQRPDPPVYRNRSAPRVHRHLHPDAAERRNPRPRAVHRGRPPPERPRVRPLGIDRGAGGQEDGGKLTTKGLRITNYELRIVRSGWTGIGTTKVTEDGAESAEECIRSART